MLYKNAYKKLCSLSATLLLVLFLSADFYAAPGDLDPTFGNGGIVITPTGNMIDLDYPRAMTIQSDGKIIVVGEGSFGTFNWDFAVVRYNTNGTLDTTFGGSGIVITQLTVNYDGAFSVAIQADGKIVVAGSHSNCFCINNSSFAVVRYNPNGTLDTSFNGTGKVITQVNSSWGYAKSVAIQADGKIVVAGNSGNYNFAIVRYNVDGSLDTTFNGTGKVITPGGSGANSVAIQADGKIIAAGSSPFTLVRYNTDGTLDTSFNGTGKVITSVGNAGSGAEELAIQPDGKIVAAGYAVGANNDFAFVRYNPNGSLDTSFGGTGKIIIPIGNSFDYAYSVAIQADGKIVAAGSSSNNSGSDFAVVRLNPNGSLDTTFNGTGKVTTAFGGQDFAVATAIQADGKIVVAGGIDYFSDFYTFAVVRYQGGSNSSIRTRFDFDGDGRADVSVFRPTDRVWYLNQSTNGLSATQFGLSTDKPVAADYDGDGKTDIGVFRPSNGTWYLLRSQQGSTATQFGQAGDVPVPADYDNDGRADIAVFRPSNGTWYLLGSTAGFSAVQFGQQGDVPVAGDFDADGRADQVVFRPSNGTWYLQQSQAGYTAVQFGMNGDVPTAGDFDADGRHDIAVFRPSNGTWYRLNSSNNQVVAVQFGSAEDLPAPADFDGDGRTDIAVFRPSNGSWYLLQSQSGFSAVQFGASGDRPAPSAQQP
jgi:uncharacterized delta-60 repeat protein